MRLRTQPDAPLLTQAAGIPLRAVKYAATRSSFFSVLKLDQLKEIIFYLDIEAFRNLTLTCLALLRLRTSSVFLGDSLQFYYPRPLFFTIDSSIASRASIPADFYSFFGKWLSCHG